MMRRWWKQAIGGKANTSMDDVVFVSYPKCGTTWTRVLLGKYVQLMRGGRTMPLFDGTPYEAVPGAQAIPSIRFTHEPLVWEDQRPEHLTIANTIAPFASTKVVLLIRNPLDALVSSYMQFRHQTDRALGDLPEFIADPVLGIEKLIAFYQLWAENRGQVGAFLLLRYEDMRQDTMRELTRLLAFLDIPLQRSIATEAITFSSFEQMKAMQTSPDAPVYPSSGFKIFGNVDPSNPDSMFVRQGLVGGYRQLLPASVCEALEAMLDRRLDPFFGYSMRPQAGD